MLQKQNKIPKQIFYETAYPESGKKDKQKTTLGGRLYLFLKRFEDYREDVVYQLLPHGERFLDVGCGEGNLVFKALAKFKYVQGVDIARTRLRKAKEFQKKLPISKKNRMKFIQVDVDDKLPFSDDCFDAVTMVATLEHFFDPIHVLKEVSRIIKPGGKLIVQVPNLAFLPRRITVFLGNLPITSDEETGWDGGHLHYFTVSSLENALQSSGYRIDQTTCSGVFARFRAWWVSLLAGDIIISATKGR